VLAASTIKLHHMLLKPAMLNSMQLYLSNHAGHVRGIELHNLLASYGQYPILQQLPHGKLQKLNSLSCKWMRLQLQPGGGFQGVLSAGAPLKQLKLHCCELLDNEDGLSAALSLLPDLQHLSLDLNSGSHANRHLQLPSKALLGLSRLTYLELHQGLQDSDGFQQLRCLTCLQDLRLNCFGPGIYVGASMMSGLKQLTRLTLKGRSGEVIFEPGALAGKTLLQHLELPECKIAGGSVGVAELMHHLHQLEHCTHLNLCDSLRSDTAVVSSPAAATFSALTASSKLQHLNISGCPLPAGVWQHIFPAGKQLQHLRALNISHVHEWQGPATTPDGNRLVGCCPGLQSLQMRELQYNAELLAPLSQLSRLSELYLLPAERSPEGLEVVCQLTGLRRLEMWVPKKDKSLLLLVAQLKHLTHFGDGRCLQLTGGPRSQGVSLQC
jgi:hypothetical protein